MLLEIEQIESACQALSTADRASLEQLLLAHGIAAEYIAYSGNTVHIPLRDRVNILQLKGENIFSGPQLDTSKVTSALTALRDAEWFSVLSPVTVLSEGGAETIRLLFSAAQLRTRWHWQIETERNSATETVLAGTFLPEILLETERMQTGEDTYSARSLPIRMLVKEMLPPGYHRFSLHPESSPAQTCTMALIVAPARCYEPAWAVEGKRLWGLTVQLYGLQSARNWGVGDFSDLQELIRMSARQGVSFLALNPLHALDTENPQNCSPYSPVDRRRLNVIYIDPEIEPEFVHSQLTQKESLQKHQRLAQTDSISGRQGALIDYSAIMRLKLEVLAGMFDRFVTRHLQMKTARGLAFEKFVLEHSAQLQEFAEFEAQRAASMDNSCGKEPRFYLYTQWLAEQQLAACQALALQLGMRLGLIRDLAVGSAGEGAEVSLSNGLFCKLTSIGAPPDPLAPQGQNWGFPPLDPLRLRHNAYQHFIELLRANMAHCGALRIDHVMALMRLWWCPRGSQRGEGAYVHYPVEDLFMLLRLESQRNRCVVVGEDLGVVPTEIRAYLHSSAVFSNVLFYFEKYDGIHFKRPQHYTKKALAMVANHDVPTLAAWWNISDLQLRFDLGLIKSDSDLAEQRRQRREEKVQALRLLEEQWLLPENWHGEVIDNPFDQALCLALLKCCARSESQLLAIQLEDFMLLEVPINIPGTSTQYPNWQRQLPIDLHELLNSESSVQIMTEVASMRSD